jgi:AcrR family transcriptional regulator
MPNNTSIPGRRLTPEARRRQIIEATRALINEQPDLSFSTADVAAAAGVTRALVHHYFHGIDELRQAVAYEVARGAATILGAGPGTPVAARVRANVDAFLDALDANRNIWLATIAADGEAAADKPAGRLLRQTILEQILKNNADLITDTPWARLCLTGYIGFSDAICKQWVRGEISRPDVAQALTETLLHLLLHTIPAGGAVDAERAAIDSPTPRRTAEKRPPQVRAPH